jgi:hypothetical protein
MLHSKLIRSVEEIDLNLNNKVVLTEAASGAYIVTPVLAAIAGAKVFAFTRDTAYGSVQDIRKATLELAQKCGVENRVEVIDMITDEVLSQADVVTNSGHLRPLDTDKLSKLNSDAVISLMYEAWEFRPQDIDLTFLRSRGLRIGATNERHSDIDVFGYLGDMAVRLIQSSGSTPYRNRFVLLCNNDFGPFIAKTLSAVCDKLGVIDTAERKGAYQNLNIDWLGSFPEINIPESYRNSEAILLSAYPFTEQWIGDENAMVRSTIVREQFSNPKILRYIGDINETHLSENGISFFPPKVKSGHMGVIPSDVGFDPVIRLQKGGLKVAELLIKNETEFRGQNMVQQIN